MSDSVAQVVNTSNLLYIALSFGLSLAVNVWIFFRVSGGMSFPCLPGVASELTHRRVNQVSSIPLSLSECILSELSSLYVQSCSLSVNSLRVSLVQLSSTVFFLVSSNLEPANLAKHSSHSAVSYRRLQRSNDSLRQHFNRPRCLHRDVLDRVIDDGDVSPFRLNPSDVESDCFCLSQLHARS